MFNDYAIFLFLVIGAGASLMLLIRIVFFTQIKQTAAQANADLIVWFLYREKWDGSPNSILYAWRTVLYELKNQQAPAEQIAAAERAVQYYERKLTKPRWMVGKGKIWKKTTVGGAS